MGIFIYLLGLFQIALGLWNGYIAQGEAAGGTLGAVQFGLGVLAMGLGAILREMTKR